MHKSLSRYSNVMYLSAAVCMLFSWLVPNHYFPWATFYNDFLAALSIWLVLLGLTLRHPDIRIPYNLLWLFLLALTPLIQFAAGVIFFAGDAIMASAYLAGFTIALWAGRQLYDDHHDKFFLAVAACFICGATLSSIFALYQWFGLTGWGNWVADIPLGGRPFANLGQPNNFALLECLGLISLLYCWESKAISKGLAILIACILIIGVVLSQSRTPWAIAIVFITWWLWKRNSIGLRVNPIIVVALLALYGFIFFDLSLLSEWLRLPTIAGNLERALEVDDVRRIIWQQLSVAIWQGPLWGYGWNQAGVAQVAVAALSPLSVFTEHSHNFFLDLLIWNGPVIGGFIVLSIVVWGLRQAFYCTTLAGWFGLACIAFMLAHGMLEYPLEYAYFLFPLGLVVGAVMSVQEQTGEQPAEVRVSRWSIAFVGLVAGIFLVFVFSEYKVMEEDSRLMRFETARIGNIKAKQKAPDVIILTQLREFNRFARTEAQINMSSDELKWMEQVAHRYAYPPALLRYSLALFLNGRPEEGRLELARLRQLHGESNFEDAKRNLKLLADKYSQLKEFDL